MGKNERKVFLGQRSETSLLFNRRKIYRMESKIVWEKKRIIIKNKRFKKKADGFRWNIESW